MYTEYSNNIQVIYNYFLNSENILDIFINMLMSD